MSPTQGSILHPHCKAEL